MILLSIVFAAALSAGNVEFEEATRTGAVNVAIARLTRETVAAPAVAEGSLRDAMLAEPAKFAKAAEAESACRDVYRGLVDGAYRAAAKRIAERMGLENAGGDLGPDAMEKILGTHFPSAYARERAAACAEQAKGLAGTIRPPESEFESKDDATLRREMTDKVAAQQKGAVFEENLKFISETIVDPVIDSAKKEMKRQREYLTRTRCESYAPSALAKELESNLRRNVTERKAKADDPSKAWDVFPKTFAEGVSAAVEHRTLERVAKHVDDVPVAVDAESILKTISSDPAAHRKASDSETVFRGLFTAAVLDGALARTEGDAPERERAEFAEYVRAHAASPEIARAVETRIRREVLPKWREARAAVAKAEADRIWPALADRTWYPDAELADGIAARSDYAEAVKAWRKEPGLEALARADGGKPLMEETDADADRSVSAAFDLARNAIAAQNMIVGEVEPSVLGEARDRKSSFWKATPDFKAIVGMLTEAVEAKWSERRVATLWGEGERPANAADQHAALFPSVRRRIELVAKSILEEMEKPEPEEEKKPEPEEKPEDPTESEEQTEEEQLMEFSIVVQRKGDEVSVRLEQGKSTLAERSAKARMSDYRGAIKYVSDKLGTDILKLQ